MKKKNDKRRLKKLYKAEIPDYIKVLFGKFYVFSFFYLVFFFVIYPFLLLKRISLFNLVAIICFFGLFYIWIVIDVFRKKKEYNSSLFIILLVLVLAAISFSVIKLLVFLEI